MLVALPQSLEAEVAAFAKGVRATEHRGTSHIVDDDGFCHVRGEYGNAQRQAFEYTKAEAVALRGLLRKAGYVLPLDAVEGLLAEALANLDGAGYDSGTMASNAERQRRWRDSRPAGICQRCPRYLMRPAKEGRTLCEDCIVTLAENVRRSRKRRRAAAAPPVPPADTEVSRLVRALNATLT